MGYTWSPREERLHRRSAASCTVIISCLPKRMLMHPRTRSRGTGPRPVTADAPLVETPARNLPPVD